MAGKVDCQIVVGGVYKFFNTTGTPLEIIFDFLKEQNHLISWLDLYYEAKENGMKHTRILSKIEGPTIDCFGVDYWKVVEERLNEICGS